MVDAATIRRLALALPEVEDHSGDETLSFKVGGKGLAWTYLARQAPKAPRRPVPGVIAVRCTLDRKEMLVEAAPERFFDDDHYRGYPAVLVRLDAVDEAEFAAFLTEAWRLTAPKALVKRHGAASLD